MGSVKSLIARFATTRLGVEVVRRSLLGRGGTIFTLHRFGSAGDGSGGLDPALLDGTLGELSNLGFRFLALAEMIDQARGGELGPRSIAWTVDDGYADFAEVAMPVFERHSCPVTMFLVTGFIDGKVWPWWDQLSLIAAKAGLAGDVTERLTGELKRVPDERKWAEIRSLAAAHRVDLPHAPPAQYRAMSWDQARACVKRGATFGPHSINHPVLPQVNDTQAAAEISDSWARVKAELGDAAVPILAYPNGDYGHREIELVRAAGLVAALTTRNGHIDQAAVRNQPFELPRFDLRPEPVALRQIVSGMEAAKLKLRQRRQRAAG